MNVYNYPGLCVNVIKVHFRCSVVFNGRLLIPVPPGGGPCRSGDGKVPGRLSDHPVQRIGLRLGFGTQQATAARRLWRHAVAAYGQLQ